MAMQLPVRRFDDQTTALVPEIVGQVFNIMRGLAQEDVTIKWRDMADIIWLMDWAQILEKAMPDNFFRHFSISVSIVS
ncbi:ABC-type polar amino acid transport system ATPase subunit [Erwinia persicina]|uniref:hypothetical protein n=1 Tax=Erwinia persicina TaxID=55211 RepID=UPI0020A08556|nr:hypothetical protein [Erwinia persicina]MCP1439653.1 ABC-type polar amino acid transport system ATPase subunit [Erwinia persicina]